MDIVVVAALSGILGAVVGLAGALITESFRQRGNYRQWRLDRLLELYSEMLEVSRHARNMAYEARRRTIQLDGVHAKQFRALLTKVELLGSQEVIDRAAELNSMIHHDFHVAEATTDLGRPACQCCKISTTSIMSNVLLAHQSNLAASMRTTSINVVQRATDHRGVDHRPAARLGNCVNAPVGNYVNFTPPNQGNT